LKKEEVLAILKLKEKLLEENKDQLVDLMKESAQVKVNCKRSFNLYK